MATSTGGVLVVINEAKAVAQEYQTNTLDPASPLCVLTWKDVDPQAALDAEGDC